MKDPQDRSVSTDDREISASLTTNTLDRSVLLSFVDGEEDLLKAVVGLFLGSYPQILSAMRDAITRNDGGALARSAHTLRGSGGFFLTPFAHDTLTDLELLGRSGDLTTAQARLLEFETEMDRLKSELSALVEEDV
jgi:HPt (histidine-containing phosphotransfer) domain-containing protein